MVQAFGPLSAQMLVHIVLMNAVAPLAVMVYLAPLTRRPWPRFLFAATLVQVALLWAWHAPPALAAAMQSDALHAAMQVSLFVAALWFWSAVLSERAARWRAILSLLVTGKLFCLLGVLLVFAPRALYPGMSGGTAFGPMLGDQQLAGLLMLVACPATYLVAGVVLAARWLTHIERAGHPAAASRNARRPA